MSWDIFVQDLPAGIESIAEIPDDFHPGPICTRSAVIEAISEVVPTADFSNDQCGHLIGPDFVIDVSLSKGEHLTGFAFNVYGGEMAPTIITRVLDKLCLRALDPSSSSGLFQGDRNEQSLKRFLEYKKAVTLSRSSG